MLAKAAVCGCLVVAAVVAVVVAVVAVAVAVAVVAVAVAVVVAVSGCGYVTVATMAWQEGFTLKILAGADVQGLFIPQEVNHFLSISSIRGVNYAVEHTRTNMP